MISAGFEDWNESFFEREPYILVQFGSCVMTIGAYALKAGVIPALIYSAPFGNGGLNACGIGAEYGLGSAINVAI